MKTTIQIGAQIGVLILVMLVLTLPPIRTGIARVARPAVSRVEHGLQRRFPALIALHSIWEANSETPKHPASCGRGPFSAC